MDLPSDETFDSWPELLDALLHRSHMNWIYRGHANSEWRLETSLQRAIAKAGSDRQGDPLRAERGVQRRFMERASAYLPDVPDEHDELTWLTLMQHYGVPTRLLDWTKSPLIGLYFAYEEEADGDSDGRALWGLQAFMCRNEFGSRFPFHMRDPFGLVRHQTYSDSQLVSDTRPGAEYDWIADENATLRRLRDDGDTRPYPVLPPYLNDRMAAQQAFFTYDAALTGGVPFDFSIPVPVVSPEGAQIVETPLVRRIMLPHEWRRDVLAALRTMGITAANLFPGLDGLGRAARMSVFLPDELEDQLGA